MPRTSWTHWRKGPGFVSDWDGKEALADVLAAQLGEAIAEPDPPVSAGGVGAGGVPPSAGGGGGGTPPAPTPPADT
eukprot:10269945-Alexandrium_andersonii.AAC.1